MSRDPSGLVSNQRQFKKQRDECILTVKDAVFSEGIANQKTLYRQSTYQLVSERRIPIYENGSLEQ
jgi:hypothetical protein